MPKISVICVTNRDGWHKVLLDDLDRQTFHDFEVIVANDALFYHKGLTHLENWQIFRPREKFETDAWNLNKAYNDCLDRAEGELLVFLQDFIWIPDDGLQRFWDDYQAHPNAFITGVGHKAKEGLQGISEEDHRMAAYPDGVSKCKSYFAEWEMNWACAPRSIMPRFNEKMDEWYGGENQYVAKVAMLEGRDILIDRNNVCIGYSQDACGGRPVDWEERHCWRDGRLQAFLHYLDLTHK